MEEKLKSFGELLEETLGPRLGDDVSDKPQLIQEDSASLSDEDRLSILKQVAGTTGKDKIAAAQKISEGQSEEDSADLSFGELLERTAQVREQVEEEDTSATEEIREAVIEKSKVDFTTELLQRFLR